jgi:broad specificity phosphatase PhoE
VIDSAQAILDRRLTEAGVERRRELHARLREIAFARVWDQVDREPPMTELERARFLLRRLYPDLEGPRLDAVMERLGAEWEAGTWTGFVRPMPIRADATASAESGEIRSATW